MTDSLQPRPRRLAMLIDGDNAQPSIMDKMIAETSKYGTVTIRRIYGDWTESTMKSWKQILHTYAVQPIQQFRYTIGKNATDSALIIDAMDILYTAGVDGLCLVSSDSDYTKLAMRIREKNLFVMGIGKKTTPRAFVNACDTFVYVENLADLAPALKPIPLPILVTKSAPRPAARPATRPPAARQPAPQAVPPLNPPPNGTPPPGNGVPPTLVPLNTPPLSAPKPSPLEGDIPPFGSERPPVGGDRPALGGDRLPQSRPNPFAKPAPPTENAPRAPKKRGNTPFDRPEKPATDSPVQPLPSFFTESALPSLTTKSTATPFGRGIDPARYDGDLMDDDDDNVFTTPYALRNRQLAPSTVPVVEPPASEPVGTDAPIIETEAAPPPLAGSAESAIEETEAPAKPKAKPRRRTTPKAAPAPEPVADEIAPPLDSESLFDSFPALADLFPADSSEVLLGNEPVPEADGESDPAPSPDPEVDNIPPDLNTILRTAFELAVADDGWAHLSSLGTRLRQLDPGFDPRTYGHKQLLLLVQGHPEIFELRKRKSKTGTTGTTYYVRFLL